MENKSVTFVHYGLISLVALVLGSPMFIFAQDAPGKTTPAAQLAAAWAKLDAFKSYRERRVHWGAHGRGVTQIVERSGELELWIQVNADQAVFETMWENKTWRSARRNPPSGTWTCRGPVPGATAMEDPPSVVTDGGALVVDGQPAHRFVEEFDNMYADSRVRTEVDVATATGIPIRVIKSELHKNGFRTAYKGTFYDLGVPIVLVFPKCP